MQSSKSEECNCYDGRGMQLEWDGGRKERKEKYVNFHDAWLASQPLGNHRQVAGKQQARPGNSIANTRQSRLKSIFRKQTRKFPRCGH